MNISVRQRLERLEQRRLVTPILLTMQDGSQRSIRGDVKHWQRLNQYVFTDGDIPTEGPLQAELEWLAAAVTIEGANQQVFALTQALLQGGIETVEDSPNEIIEGTFEDAGWEPAHHLRLVGEGSSDQ